mmetsp:Transcript_15760/g.53485  ORF Transcript_15760/g.53485 Transcript_15760/m.53485 type:complete len:238 (-) Transcript_15760:69-782(-)
MAAARARAGLHVDPRLAPSGEVVELGLGVATVAHGEARLQVDGLVRVGPDVAANRARQDHGHAAAQQHEGVREEPLVHARAVEVPQSHGLPARRHERPRGRGQRNAPPVVLVPRPREPLLGRVEEEIVHLPIGLGDEPAAVERRDGASGVHGLLHVEVAVHVGRREHVGVHVLHGVVLRHAVGEHLEQGHLPEVQLSGREPRHLHDANVVIAQKVQILLVRARVALAVRHHDDEVRR